MKIFISKNKSPNRFLFITGKSFSSYFGLKKKIYDFIYIVQLLLRFHTLLHLSVIYQLPIVKLRLHETKGKLIIELILDRIGKISCQIFTRTVA